MDDDLVEVKLVHDGLIAIRELLYRHKMVVTAVTEPVWVVSLWSPKEMMRNDLLTVINNVLEEHYNSENRVNELVIRMTRSSAVTEFQIVPVGIAHLSARPAGGDFVKRATELLIQRIQKRNGPLDQSHYGRELGQRTP